MRSTTSGAIGSIDKLYDLLQQAAVETPVEGNAGGSYLTMKSNQGLVFGAATILSGFAGVFCDQGKRIITLSPFALLNGTCAGYWQRVRTRFA